MDVSIKFLRQIEAVCDCEEEREERSNDPYSRITHITHIFDISRIKFFKFNYPSQNGEATPRNRKQINEYPSMRSHHSRS